MAVDIGGALVTGDRNIVLEGHPYQQAAKCSPLVSAETCAEMISDYARTDVGSGLALGLRLGYNFFGYAALEAVGFGSGNLGSGGGEPEGSVHVSFIGRYFPLQHVDSLANRKLDPSVYIGGGFSYMGYHLEYDPTNDGRGWFGGEMMFGAALDYFLAPSFSIGVDLRFVMPFYNKYYYSWENDLDFSTESTPTTLIFAPMATFTFHFFDPAAL